MLNLNEDDLWLPPNIEVPFDLDRYTLPGHSNMPPLQSRLLRVYRMSLTVAMSLLTYTESDVDGHIAGRGEKVSISRWDSVFV